MVILLNGGYMKYFFHSFLLVSILATGPAQAINLPAIPWKTVEQKGKILADRLSSLFSYQNQCLQQQGPKHLGQRFMGEQVRRRTAAALDAPQPPLAIDGRRRHHQMDMRVIVQPARVGVQHRDGAGRALKLLVVLTEGAQCFPGAAHEQVVDDALVRPRQGTKFRGHGEGQQKVRTGDLTLELALQPLLALVMLAMRTRAMATRVRHEVPILTRFALHLHARAARGTTVLHRVQGPALAGQQLAAVAGQQVRLEGADDRCHRNHRTAPQVISKAAINASIRSMARWPVRSVRWVYLAVVRIEW